MGRDIESFKQGAELVGKAAGEKFNQISSQINDITGLVESTNAYQEGINDAIIAKIDRQDGDILALKDNRHYIKSSRHTLDDMEIDEQQLVAAWLQKLLQQMDMQGFAISPNQQNFLSNFQKYIGILDESFQVEHLAILDKMGEGGTHRAIYKIFLALIYLHDASFGPLAKLSEIDEMFKLSAQTKKDEQDLLEGRVQTLGLEGIVATYDQDRPINSFTVKNVLSPHIELGTHPALSWNLTKNQLEDYVRSFALLAIDAQEDDSEKLFSFNENQKTFLSAISKKLGCPTVLFELDTLCKNPRNVNIETLKLLLNEDIKKYTWLLDVISLLVFGNNLRNNDELILSIMRVIGIGLNNNEDFITAAKKLASSDEQSDIVNSIFGTLAKNTDGWEHILSFRGMNLTGAFSSLKDRLGDISSSIANIQDELSDVDSEVTDLSFESEFKQNMKRGGLYKRLNTIKDKATHLIIHNSESVCLESVKIIRALIRTSTCLDVFTNLVVRAEFLRDKHLSSSSSEDWTFDFSDGVSDVEKCLDGLDKLVDFLIEQLSLFEDGYFRESLEERNIKLAQAKREREDKEREAKATAVLGHEGHQIRISIAWEDLNEEDIPFDPSNIKHAATDGEILLISDDNEIYCGNGHQWTRIKETLQLEYVYQLESIRYVNSAWIIETDNSIYISVDAKNWSLVSLPESPCYKPKPHLQFEDPYWILRISKEESYTYEEKGFIWSTTETAEYNSPVFYRTTDLGAKWEEWKEVNDFPRSGFIPCSNIAVCNKICVATFAYDLLYQDRKKIETSSFSILYLKDKRTWQYADSPFKDDDWRLQFNRDANILSWNNSFLLATCGSLYVSEKGFDWVDKKIQTSGKFGICENILILFPENGDKLVLSTDAKSFSELMLDNGKWTVVASMNHTLLATWKENNHETVLKKGTLHYEIY